MDTIIRQVHRVMKRLTSMPAKNPQSLLDDELEILTDLIAKNELFSREQIQSIVNVIGIYQPYYRHGIRVMLYNEMKETILDMIKESNEATEFVSTCRNI